MSNDYLPPAASEPEMEARHRIAAAVVEALTTAGLPAEVSTRSGPRLAGAEVEVDRFADESGGVFVHWKASDRLLERFSAPVLAREFDHPAILLNGSIASAMAAALQEILTASGFRVEACEDDYRTFSLRVISG